MRKIVAPATVRCWPRREAEAAVSTVRTPGISMTSQRQDVSPAAGVSDGMEQHNLGRDACLLSARASSPDAEVLRPTSPAAELTRSRRTPRYYGKHMDERTVSAGGRGGDSGWRQQRTPRRKAKGRDGSLGGDPIGQGWHWQSDKLCVCARADRCCAQDGEGGADPSYSAEEPEDDCSEGRFSSACRHHSCVSASLPPLRSPRERGREEGEGGDEGERTGGRRGEKERFLEASSIH
uniref:Uncharacterized protein n=1 Tax=Oryza sativa subsp. japonica TaxID=39947 RepID=Q6ZGB5_ORYSJ|nr:hypothetical protein [Oryza sativa Japonica Group]